MKKDRMTQVKDYQNFLTKFRKKIPEKYNQIELAGELMNKDLDFYISISNRSDGKTFNYISFFMKLAIEFGINFTLISRHFTLRNAYMELIEKIADESPHFNPDQLYIRTTQHYASVGYNGDDICVIIDLNNATDLKYHSNYIKDFPIIVYDEFLALESDYMIDEWEKLKTIYESIDRNHGDIDYIQIPKMFLLGNAVNFSSPILANLDIYEELQTQQINSVKQYDNVIVEMRRNDYSNEQRNTRAFRSDNDAMTTGEFEYNDYNLADDALRQHINRNGDIYYIKTESYYIKVMFNVNDYQTNLKVVPYAEDYVFCTNVRDVKSSTTFLKDTFYKEGHEKKYYRPSNLHFDNAYSKTFIVNDMNLILLDINKCTKHFISHQLSQNQDYTMDNNISRHEKMYEDQYIERTKAYLLKRYS